MKRKFDQGMGATCYYDMAYDEVAFRVENCVAFSGVNELAKPLEFIDQRIGMGVKSYEPTFRLTHSAAQHLFEQLWEMGCRPKDGTGNGGHIEAMKYHLEDMRKLVFKDQK